MTQTRLGEPKLESLTARQREVAELIADRYSQKEIAAVLGISETSVQRHVTAIKQRLAVNSLREIATSLRDLAPSKGWESPTVQKNDVASPAAFWPQRTTDEPYALSERDAGELNFLPRLPEPVAPRIVPRLLDGKHRVLFRIAFVGGIVASAFALIVLAVAAIQSISEIVRGSHSEQVMEQTQRPRGSVREN
jgi:DNA-binding CsgD family transcriptional regulator